MKIGSYGPSADSSGLLCQVSVLHYLINGKTALFLDAVMSGSRPSGTLEHKLFRITNFRNFLSKAGIFSQKCAFF